MIIKRFKITGSNVKVTPDENGQWVSYNDHIGTISETSTSFTNESSNDSVDDYSEAGDLTGIKNVIDTVNDEKDKLIEHLTNSITEIKLKSLSEASEFAGFYLKQLKDLRNSLKNRGFNFKILHPDGSTE